MLTDSMRKVNIEVAELHIVLIKMGQNCHRHKYINML